MSRGALMTGIPRWRCRVGWHQWTPWTAPLEKETMRRSIFSGLPIEGTDRVVSYIEQTRECGFCKLHQRREIG